MFSINYITILSVSSKKIRILNEVVWFLSKATDCLKTTNESLKVCEALLLMVYAFLFIFPKGNLMKCNRIRKRNEIITNMTSNDLSMHGSNSFYAKILSDYGFCSLINQFMNNTDEPR